MFLLLIYLGIIHPYSHILYTKPKPETNEIEESLKLNQSSDHEGNFRNFLPNISNNQFSIDLLLDDDEVELCIGDDSNDNESNDEIIIEG